MIYDNKQNEDQISLRGILKETQTAENILKVFAVEKVSERGLFETAKSPMTTHCHGGWFSTSRRNHQKSPCKTTKLKARCLGLFLTRCNIQKKFL